MREDDFEISRESENNTEELMIRTFISSYTGMNFNHRAIPRERAALEQLKPENVRKPSRTFPGSEERIKVYEQRANLNIPIFNPKDRKINDGFDTDIS